MVVDLLPPPYLRFMRKYLYLLLTFYPFQILAQGGSLEDYSGMQDQAREMAEAAGFGSNTSSSTLSTIISNLVSVFLGLLGVIFLVLAIVAGYNWMTAGGDEDKVAKAKKTLSRAVIGLIIIVASYAITYFVFTALDLGQTS